MRHNLFDPIRVPQGMLFRVGSCRREDGRILGVYRLGHPEDGPILTEDPMDQLIECEVVKVQPMKVPSSLIFYQDYKVGDALDRLGRDGGEG